MFDEVNQTNKQINENKRNGHKQGFALVHSFRHIHLEDGIGTLVKNMFDNFGLWSFGLGGDNKGKNQC